MPLLLFDHIVWLTTCVLDIMSVSERGVCVCAAINGIRRMRMLITVVHRHDVECVDSAYAHVEIIVCYKFNHR